MNEVFALRAEVDISHLKRESSSLLVINFSFMRHPTAFTLLGLNFRLMRSHFHLMRQPTKLIVSDLRANEMAQRSDVFLHPRPGTDLVWLSAVTRYLFENGLVKTKFIHQWVNGLDDYIKNLKPFTLEKASERCGIPIDTLKQVAHMIADAGNVCILWGKAA